MKDKKDNKDKKSKKDRSLREELDELAQQYVEIDTALKMFEGRKLELRERLFSIINELVEQEIVLETKEITVDQAIIDEVYGGSFAEWKRNNYPTWILLSAVLDGDKYILKLREDPSYVKYEFQVGKYRLGRTVVTPSPTFNAEAFVTDHPDLADLVDKKVTIEYNLNETKACLYMADNPESKKIFEKYLHLGQPSVRMLPVRMVEEE